MSFLNSKIQCLFIRFFQFLSLPKIKNNKTVDDKSTCTKLNRKEVVTKTKTDIFKHVMSGV